MNEIKMTADNPNVKMNGYEWNRDNDKIEYNEWIKQWKE